MLTEDQITETLSAHTPFDEALTDDVLDRICDDAGITQAQAELTIQGSYLQSAMDELDGMENGKGAQGNAI